MGHLPKIALYFSCMYILSGISLQIFLLNTHKANSRGELIISFHLDFISVSPEKYFCSFHPDRCAALKQLHSISTFVFFGSSSYILFCFPGNRKETQSKCKRIQSQKLFAEQSQLHFWLLKSQKAPLRLSQ